jgi:group I intron endonuclease
MIGIYKITNPEGKVYIGKSKDIEKRFESYKQFQHKQQPSLYNSFKKYGWVNHEYTILEECNEDIILDREKYYINEYKQFCIVLNKTQGGKGIKKITESDKIIRSNRMKQMWDGGKVIGRKGRKFIDIKNNKQYNSIAECVKDLNISITKIHNNLKRGVFIYVK